MLPTKASLLNNLFGICSKTYNRPTILPIICCICICLKLKWWTRKNYNWELTHLIGAGLRHGNTWPQRTAIRKHTVVEVSIEVRTQHSQVVNIVNSAAIYSRLDQPLDKLPSNLSSICDESVRSIINNKHWYKLCFY